MSIILEGRKDIVSSYFQKNDLYLGLWDVQDINHSITLDKMSSIELNKNEYSRKKLDKTLWVIGSNTITYPTVQFKSLTQVWDNLKGYFIATTTDNTGKIILINPFILPVKVVVGDFINIDIDLTF